MDYHQLAWLFRADTEVETIHVHNHLRTLNGIKTKKETLQEAIAGETHRSKKMYPEMTEKVKGEGHKVAVRTFPYVNEVERSHAKLYQKSPGQSWEKEGELSLLCLPSLRIYSRKRVS